MVRELELVPESPADLGLPHPSWWQHQREAVENVLAGFERGHKVLLSAPTGSGKTLIGSAVARVQGGTSMFLAHTIYLQRQQLRTLPQAATATGRANHRCLLPDPFGQELTAAEAPCPCLHAVEGGCGYYNQLFACAEADEVVLNYAYAVRVCKAHGMKATTIDPESGLEVPLVLPNPFVNRGLLVCDEAHLLERALIDADTIEVSRRTFDRLHVPLPSTAEMGAWQEWANKWVMSVANRVTGLLKSFRAVEHPHRDDIREARSLQSAYTVISEVLQINPQGVPYYVGRTPMGFQIRPLWAWYAAHNLLFKYGDDVVIMSATLGDPALTTRLLGIEPDDWSLVEVPSTFPVENRPVFYWPVMKMRYNNTYEEKMQQVHALAHLAAKFPNSAGVVHCCSYDLGRFLVENAGIYPDLVSRLLFHDSQGREATFQGFEAHPGNRILVTPAATTGVDWDFVGWQMIPKVPFPDLSDDIVRLRYEYQTEEGEPIGKRVYLQEAALAVVQASGRCVRTPTSKGVTIITDGAFWTLFKFTSPASFPGWFRDAVRWYKPNGG